MKNVKMKQMKHPAEHLWMHSNLEADWLQQQKTTGCHSCQLRTGSGGYNSHMLTKVDQIQKTRKCCLIWWFLLSAATFGRVWIWCKQSDSTDPSLYQQLRMVEVWWRRSVILKVWPAPPPAGHKRYCRWATVITEIQFVINVLTCTLKHLYTSIHLSETVIKIGNWRWLVCDITHYSNLNSVLKEWVTHWP